jgi:DHA2 family multidrug resistance protein-like MFS transporter
MLPPTRGTRNEHDDTTAGEFGAALGVAVMGVIGATVYRTDIRIPGGLPDSRSDAVHSSITEAVNTARHLPGGVATDLLQSARDAYTDGMHAVALVTAALYLGLAALAVAGLRQITPIGAQPTPAPSSR